MTQPHRGQHREPRPRQVHVLLLQEPEGLILITLCPKHVKRVRELVEIKGDPVWLEGQGRSLDRPRPGAELAQQGELGRVRQALDRGPLEVAGDLVVAVLLRPAEHRADAGMGVLDVEDRVVLRLLRHLGEVEVERRVVLAGQHDEADDVAPDLVDHVAERDDAAGALAHLQRPALVEQVDELAEPDVELRPARPSQRRDGRLHPLDVAAVVRPPDVDHQREAAADFVAVVGEVGREIGPGPVRALERAVDLVAERGRAEEELRHRLPVLDRLRPWAAAACRCRPAPWRRGRRAPRSMRAARDQVALGGEDVVEHAERLQVGADQQQHRLDADPRRSGSSHSASGASSQRLPSRLGDLPRDGDEVGAGVAALGHRPDVLAQRLAVAVVDRAGQRLDLRPAVVDVIFTSDVRIPRTPAGWRARRRTPCRGRGRHAAGPSGWPSSTRR